LQIVEIGGLPARRDEAKNLDQAKNATDTYVAVQFKFPITVAPQVCGEDA
jgi:hypothetical protein